MTTEAYSSPTGSGNSSPKASQFLIEPTAVWILASVRQRKLDLLDLDILDCIARGLSESEMSEELGATRQKIAYRLVRIQSRFCTQN